MWNSLLWFMAWNAPQHLVLKFRNYEKATKFEKISHLFWQNSCFYSVASKQMGDFFNFLWSFQKSWTLTAWKFEFFIANIFLMILKILKMSQKIDCYYWKFWRFFTPFCALLFYNYLVSKVQTDFFHTNFNLIYQLKNV